MTADVAVVGNGSIGLATALRMKQRGPDLSVCVVGPTSRVGGASAAAGAMLGCFGEVTKYTFASAAATAKFDLARAAHDMWPAFLDELEDRTGAAGLLTATDTFMILNGRSGTLDDVNFAAFLEALEKYGEPHEFVDAVPGLDPVPDARPLRIVRLPREGAVDARALLDALESACRRVSVQLIDASVQSLTAGTSSVILKLDDGASIGAGHVVLAAGVASGELAEQVLGRHAVQPVLAGSGVALLTQRVLGAGFTSAVRTVNRAGSCGLHIVPFGGSAEYVGATNVIFGQPETRAHLGVCHFLIQSAIDQLDQMLCFSRIDQTLVGNRPAPLDTFPLLGRTSSDRVTMLTGTYRDGLHLAPLIAELAAQTVVEGADAFPGVFAPERRPLQTMTVAESVRDYVGQAVSSAFEGGTALSRFIHTSELEGGYRARADAMYEQLGANIALHSDVLSYLTISRKSPGDVERVREYLALEV